MPLRNKIQYRYSVDVPNPLDRSVSRNWVAGFVDMLRYEGCTVDKFDGRTMQLVSPRTPELRRWRSFSIEPYAIHTEPVVQVRA